MIRLDDVVESTTPARKAGDQFSNPGPSISRKLANYLIFIYWFIHFNSNENRIRAVLGHFKERYLKIL